MKYERFEDLPVWQAAADVAARLLSWTTQPWFRGKGDLANQLQRSALSISNNIAEGFERGSTNELLQFLYIAGETRSMLAVMERMLAAESGAGSAKFKAEVVEFKLACEGISRQIRGWANSLQNSDIRGQRHLNDGTRQEYDQRRQGEEFRKKLNAIAEESRRNREKKEASEQEEI